MKEQTPWNRCLYCGRYIAYRDFDTGAAAWVDDPDFQAWTALEPAEQFPVHKECKDG